MKQAQEKFSCACFVFYYYTHFKYIGGIIMANETYNVHRRQKPFTMVGNDLINDENLSWAAKGLLIYLVSKPDNWKVYKSDIVKHATNSKDSVSGIFKELRNTGYMTLTRFINEGGKVIAWNYDFYEEPLETPIPKYITEKVVTEETSKKETVAEPPTKQEKVTPAPKEMKASKSTATKAATRPLQSLYGKQNLGYTAIVAHLKTSLDFNTLQKNPKFKDKLENWIFIIADYLSTKNNYVQVGQSCIPRDIATTRMLKITQYNIEQVIDNLSKVERPIKNIKSYIFSSLYNSISTLDTEIEIDLQTIY